MNRRRRAILIIHNPTAGWRRRRFLDAVLAGLDAAGCAVGLRLTTARGDAEAIAAREPLEAYDVIAVAGGDGTINEVANGLVKRDGGHLPTLAVIPTGSANVLAHEIGLAIAPEAAVGYLTAGSPRTIHLASVNGRMFLCMASAGFDAWVVSKVGARTKRMLGKGAYGLAAAAGMASWPARVLTIDADGTRLAATTAAVQNARRYGGPFVMAPGASVLSAGVELCMVAGTGRWPLMRCAADLALGRIGDSPVVERRSARRVTITGGTGPVQADGDLVGHLPAVIAADAARLELLFPSNFS